MYLGFHLANDLAVLILECFRVEHKTVIPAECSCLGKEKLRSDLRSIECDIVLVGLLANKEGIEAPGQLGLIYLINKG